MFKDVIEITSFLKAVFERATLYTLALLAAGLTLYTITCAFGLAPWLSMLIQTGPDTAIQAGAGFQVAATLLMIGLCCFIPSNARVARLEYTHRRFETNMHDVAQAYYIAHAEDRKGAFQMQSEFDSVRERIAHLRDHPDLDQMEPQILELAAQMSHVSRDLANTYSEEKVERAYRFLSQREQELDQFNSRIDQAKTIVGDLRRWNERLDLDETIARSQLISLRDAFLEALPELADFETPTAQVVAGQKEAEDTKTSDVTYPFATAAE